MKKLSFLILLNIGFFCQAQECEYETLNTNNVATILGSCGSFFFDHNSNSPNYFLESEPDISPIYSHGVWMGGYDESGELHLAAETYRQSGADYWAGPIANDYNAAYDASYNKVWNISQQMITEHQENYNTPGYITPEDIASWPAHGNTANGEASLLAPFVDINNNSVYEPSAGDYPLIKGAQALYTIFNDDRYSHTESGGDKIGAEVHAMLYAYQCHGEQYDVLSKSVFLNLTVHNRSNNNYSDFFLGGFTDIDLGVYNNDYVGCIPDMNMYYGYNANNADTGLNGYGLNPPVVGVKYLNTDMHSFWYYNNDFSPYGNPEEANHYYGYMKGYWKDNSSFTYGGTGYGGINPTTFMYPSHPYDTEGWSEYNEENTAYDRRGLAASGPYQFMAGQSITVDYAFIYARGEDLNHIENIDLLIEEALIIQDYYDGGINVDCTNNSSAVVTPKNQTLLLYPNPTKGTFSISGDIYGKIEVYNILGEKVLITLKENEVESIDTSYWKNGIYLVKIGERTTKLIVQ